MHDFSDVVRPVSVEDLPSETSTALVKASNEFAFDLWDRIRLREGNLTVSPASISLALAMTWAGARGETADQLASVLRLEGSEGIHEAAATLLHHWNDPDRTEYELPAFTVDPPDALDLAPILAGMGAPLAFDRDAADFTGMADPPDPADRLFIDSVVHKGFVRVDEAGTEAVAVTASLLYAGAAIEEAPEPEQFRADHPFLFLIRDVRSGMVLFVGRVADPRA